jgi:SNF2 family DNA or RNA helicase
MPHLPKAPIEKTHVLDFTSDEEGDFYKGIQGQLVRRWKAMKADGDANALDKLRLIMRLRQISLHPQVYIAARKRQWIHYKRPDYLLPSTKFQKLRSLIEGETESHRWIVFCHFYSEMELLEEMLQAEPTVRNVHMYNGTLSAEERKRVLEETLDPVPAGKADVLLIQLQSGGVGLNLQHFDRIIFSGPWWTSALMEQAIGRAVRIGQREVVKVYHLRLEEEEAINIDSVMMDKAAAKGELCRAVLECAEHVC